jgi:uncharacterized membrane protein
MRKWALFSVFLGLAVLGAMIKIPVVLGSIALDSLPALVAAVFFGSVFGGAVGCFGHLLSAMTAGFPLGIFHLLIGVEMGILVWLFGVLYKKWGKWLAVVVFFIGNSIVAPLPFYFILGKAFYISVVPALMIGSGINLILTYLLMPRLAGWMNQASRGEVKG